MVAFGQSVRIGLGATNRILVAQSRQNVFAIGLGYRGFCRYVSRVSMCKDRMTRIPQERQGAS